MYVCIVVIFLKFFCKRNCLSYYAENAQKSAEFWWQNNIQKLSKILTNVIHNLQDKGILPILCFGAYKSNQGFGAV